MSQLLTHFWIPEYAGTEDARVPSALLSSLTKLAESCACSPDGRGFGIHRGAVPYLETTKYAMGVLSYISWCGDAKPLAKYRDGCIRYVRELWKTSSGFADHPQGEPAVFATYYSILILKLLDAIDDDVAAGSIRYLKENADSDGLPRFADFPSDMTHCFWGGVTASVLEAVEGIYARKPLDFIAKCQHSDGSYSVSPIARGGGQTQATVEALIVRNLYKDTIDDVERRQLRTFLGRCQIAANRFGERPDVQGTPRDWLMGSIGLYTLLGDICNIAQPCLATDDLWQAFSTVTSHLAMNSKLGSISNKIGQV